MTTSSPAMFFPSATDTLLFAFRNAPLSNTSRSMTEERFLFGTSMPMAFFPGMGASILTPGAASDNAISSDRFAMRFTRTPGAGCTSYWVITGPLRTLTTLADTPKLVKVCSSCRAAACVSTWEIGALFTSLPEALLSIEIGGTL